MKIEGLTNVSSNFSLKVARQARGMTQGKLAEKIGRSRLTVTLYENGKVKPPPEMRKKLSEELNFPESSLFIIEETL